MIEGEIRVGDRLKQISSGVFFRVLNYTDACGIFNVGKDGSSDSEFGCNAVVLRSQFERVDSGWTPITPDTMPGEDVENVFGLDPDGRMRSVRIRPRPRVKETDPRSRWSHLVDSPSGFTHWRPVPDGWLPLPTKEPS